ncbi:acyl-CoA oxidase [Stemphylium lycopersici]|nr:acyl-CoA oxidase [Stemphylium lycopersici]
MKDFTDHLKPAYDGTATLQAERDGSRIDVPELAHHLLGRHGFLQRQEKVLRVLSKEKLFDKAQQLNLSRPERYQLGLARAKLIQRLVKREGWDHEDYRMAEYLNDEMSPYFLHMSMFVTTVREQASERQQRYWMPKILNYDIIGCYAQTELGHGSNVRGLETTAKWDPSTKEFEIHSPTLTASKWWNGSMGRTATHAIVVAQLLLPTSCSSPGKAKVSDPHVSDFEYTACGPQTFILQIRDEKTHQPLAGIAVGDIGPKYGYASMDNGYMLFDHFRAPKSAMLSRYAEVSDETGALIRTGHPAVVYGSLTFVRGQIIMHASLVLARAVTVAVRYCAIRRQFKDRDSINPSDEEMKVLDYPTVQIRVLPLLATTFALHFTGEYMYKLYHQSRQTIEKGNFGPLAELHSASSGLKSLCTMLAADGIETCRRAMGGHGFGGGSGLIGLNADYLSKPTVEGDNWMITQQVAAYLIKKMGDALKNPDAPAKDPTDELFQFYLKNRDHHLPQNVVKEGSVDDQSIVDIFQWRAADLSYRAYQARVVEKQPWTRLMIQLHNLSRAYSEQILVSNFYSSLYSGSPPASSALRTCFELYAIYTLDQSASSFIMTTAVSLDSVYSLQGTILDLMAELRPHAVKLVDAWSIPDWLLHSALGRYDGKVYEELFDMAHRKNPLNKVTFNPDWRSDEIVLGSGDGGRQVLAKLYKAGHECKYRDQADILFRNQTASAAQRAEESWRKRSKSHQRASTAESSTAYIKTPPSDESTPPTLDDTRSSSGSVHSPSGSTDDPSQDPSSVTASIIDLSKMTITPVVNPDFRRRAFERFVYDFVMPDSPTRPKDEPSDALWTFIPVLYQGASDDSLIATAVDAVAYVNFSNRCNDPHAATLGEECVAKAIPMLTKVIADKKQAATNEALCSVYLMGVYEAALELDGDYQAWESAITPAWSYQMTPNTPEARSAYDAKWQALFLGCRGAPEEIHAYPSLKRCWIWGFYRTSRIFLLRDLLEMLNWMLRFPEPAPPFAPASDRGSAAPQGRFIPTALSNENLRTRHAAATNHLVEVIEKTCSALIGSFTVPIHLKSYDDVVGCMDAALSSGLIPDINASSGSPQSSNHLSPPHASQYQGPHSPESFESSPQSEIRHAYATAPQFEELSNIVPKPESDQTSNAGNSPINSTPVFDPNAKKDHIFDSNAAHPYDRPLDFPLDLDIAEPKKMDVAARKEWINRLLYYVASELGLKKGLYVPFTEGLLPIVKPEVDHILGR